MPNSTKKLIYSLHPLERLVLLNLEKIVGEIANGAEENLKGVHLLEERGLLKLDYDEYKTVKLDTFGEKFLKEGLPEVKLLNAILSKEKPQSAIKMSQEEFIAALGPLKRNGLIEMRKEKELILSATPKAKAFLENHKNPLETFSKPKRLDKLSVNEKKIYEDLKMRKGFVKLSPIKTFEIRISSEAKKLSAEIKKNYSKLDLIDELTPEIIKSGSWKGKEFRHYDVSLQVPFANVARRHPMLEANNILRDVFVEMGFEEMKGPMVETAFWNMDTMWIPQDHPARDEQDTFYLDGEGSVDPKLMKKVKEMHEVGIKKTHTEKGDWSEKTAKRRLLRTHSTATTFRTLAELGEKLKKGESINGKYFYIANNFRNEAIDATHLAEFYQGEGFIVGDDLSLADLMGFVRDFYAKLGITQIKFKPTFNPYTEPSMEAHYYDPKMKKWYALINSGVFREETLKPLGLEKKRIIAWGMGASRVAALLARKDSMRDITGHTCDLGWLQNRPMMKKEIVRK